VDLDAVRAREGRCRATAAAVANGGDILEDSTGTPDLILIGTGTELDLCVKAAAELRAEGKNVRVVSMPCVELFEEQDAAWRRKVLPAGPVRVAIEAGVRFGWDRWLFGEGGKREKSGFIGMHGFGASAPADRLYAEFGITAEATADKVRSLLG
jgi:transketolase